MLKFILIFNLVCFVCNLIIAKHLGEDNYFLMIALSFIPIIGPIAILIGYIFAYSNKELNKHHEDDDNSSK